MMTTDPIADLITRIRNAARARKTMVHIPYSKMKESICVVLKKYQYIEGVAIGGEGIEKELVLELKPDKKDIHLKRISKPGQRIYVHSKEIPKVLDGLGMAVVSTPKGVMSGREARKQNLGGEYLCEVY
ncbi:30S ribosomal protein S8 [Candidatus Peregrinibacteria bacterium]|nr:30S ribosomal protein S8 [Candidatus Peregrinibacteria bacterium]